MKAANYPFIALLALAAIYLLRFRLAPALRLYLRFRGKRLVTCPETKKAAALEVAAGHAPREALVGRWHLQLDDSSRWPERQACGQECLSQIEAASEDRLVWTIVSRWYEEQTCVYCQKPFGQIKRLDHRPALLDANRKTGQWDEVAAEKLPEVLATHRPVCWNCHIAQTFRREHPDLVVDRPRKRAESPSSRDQKSRPGECLRRKNQPDGT